MSQKNDTLRLAGWLLYLKVAYILAITAAAYLFPSFDDAVFNRVFVHWPQEGSPTFASHFATWDTAHYLFLSEVGYKTGAPSCAFYPLWPMLMRGCSVATCGSHLVAGMVMANLFSLCGWVLFYQNVEGRFGKKTARLALLLLLIFPGALFFQFGYAESLFFLLLMLLWRGLEKNQPPLVFSSALLLPLTRAVGIFCVLPIAWHLFAKPCASVWSQWRHRSDNSQEPRVSVLERFRLPLTQSWLLLAPLCGWALYLMLMRSWTGNAFEGFGAQKHWGVHSVWNIINIPKFIMKFCDVTAFHEFTGSLLDRIFFLLLFYGLILIWRLGKDMLLWTLALGIIPAFSGDLTSFTRFCSMVFPLFIGLAIYFTEKPRKWQAGLFISLCVVLHGVLLWRFVNFRWAG